MPVMLPDGENRLLDKCLFCGYPLEGLPVEHACPECGEHFDRRWRVFGGQTRWEGLSVAARVVMSVLIAGPLLSNGLWMVGPVYELLTWQQAVRLRLARLALICLHVVVFWGLLFRRSRRMVAIGPEGLTIIDSKRRRRQQYDWTCISGAALPSFLPGGPVLRLRHSVSPVRLPILGTETRVCVDLINTHLRMKNGGADGSSPE